MKTDQDLTTNGFTESGRSRFKATISGYETEVYNKAINYGEADKAPNTPREVTHEHVRAAAHSVATSYGSPSRTKSSIFLQCCEYILTAAAGVGGGNLDQSWGILLLVIGVGLAVVCFVTRTLNDRN